MSTRLMEPGREVGGYRIEGLLGRTQWATTYAATSGPDRYVALKVLELDSEADPDTLATLESTLVSLVNVSHPGVLAPIDAGEIDEIGHPFVVTPLASHPSVAELVSASPLSADEVRELLFRLGSALEHAREAGISHLSLKPTNVFVGPPPELAVSIVDFGMHVLRKNETPKDDVHGAALLACYALTGDQKAADAAAANPDDLAKSLGVALDPKLEGALKRALGSGADRFATVAALAEEVREPHEKTASDRAAARHSKASQLMPKFKVPERTTRPAPPDNQPLQTKTVQMKAFGTKQFAAFKLPNQTQKLEPFRGPFVSPAAPKGQEDATVKTAKYSGNRWTELARTRPMTMLAVSAGIAIAGILAAVVAIATR